MAVIASATGAAVFGLGAGTLAAGLAGGALLGAGAGALYSGISGEGDILNSALTGALLGGTVGGLGASFGPSLMSKFGAGALSSGTTPGLTAAQMSSMTPAQVAAMTPAQLNATAAAQGVLAEGAAGLPGMGLAAAPSTITPQIMAATGAQPVPSIGLTGKEKLGYGLAGTTALSMLSPKRQLPTPPGSPSYIRPFTYSATQNPPGNEYPAPYPSTPLYNAQGIPNLDTRERDYFTQSYTAGEPYRAAQGGLMASYQEGSPVERMSQMNMAINPQGGMYPQGMIDKTQYAIPSQRPTSMEVLNAIPQRTFASGGEVKRMFGGGLSSLIPNLAAQNPQLFAKNYDYDAANQKYNNAIPAGNVPLSLAGLLSRLNLNESQGAPQYTYNPKEQSYKAMAAGGDIQGYSLGGYSDGGRLLKGPGDGVSDDIPAVIGDRQPARLADGEFVIPARIVSELGNGSTDAGAKRLYAMMDRIQEGRKKTVGKNNVAKDTKAKKHLLA